MLTPLLALLALSGLLCLTGCARVHLHYFPQCADGLPVKVLSDVVCPPDGVCGYSCLPDRWRIG